MNMNIIYEVPIQLDTTPVQVLDHEHHHQQLHEGEVPVIVNMQPVPTEPQPPDEKKPISIKLEKKKKEAIDGQAKEVIYRVIKFFESEKQNRGYAFPVENVVKRACAATGLSESTIKRIKRDGIRAETTQTKMMGPKKKRIRKTKIQLDYFQLCALRGIVNGYSIRKEVPTLGKILAAARNELNYTGGKESLRLILLNKLGIKFKKCEKKAKKPPEQPPPPPPQVQQIIQPTMMIQHPPMQHHMKQPEPMCVYSHMMPHVPPVSY